MRTSEYNQTKTQCIMFTLRYYSN